jgi:hypothetical protein
MPKSTAVPATTSTVVIERPHLPIDNERLAYLEDSSMEILNYVLLLNESNDPIDRLLGHLKTEVQFKNLDGDRCEDEICRRMDVKRWYANVYGACFVGMKALSNDDDVALALRTYWLDTESVFSLPFDSSTVKYLKDKAATIERYSYALCPSWFGEHATDLRIWVDERLS